MPIDQPMRILHISMECYPAAKAGGLGDVVGALPPYLSKAEFPSTVIIPKYRTDWLEKQQFREVFHDSIRLDQKDIPFSIQQVSGDALGFPLFVASIPGKFDRAGIYADTTGSGYEDEIERAICFQQAVLKWVISFPEKPTLLHCHDHHTGLIPFMVKHCPEFHSLHLTPTVFTIHNGMYHGAFGWEKIHLLPPFDYDARGLLDWKNGINPLAAAIKCCWKLTTVSPSYLEELGQHSNGLERLIINERPKSVGILNGIDTAVWNPKTDAFIEHPLKRSIETFKEKNKKYLLQRFNIVPDVPLISFIGRLVGEKGADLIPQMVQRVRENGIRAGFILLGTGDLRLHEIFQELRHRYSGFFDLSLEYNEGLAHQLYAGSDFLLMPSRVEPCGLNQLYALRYGTVPIVRSVGGLKDTITDIGEEEDGLGIRFANFSTDEAAFAVFRAAHLFQNKEALKTLRSHIMKVDFSWEKSAQAYIKIYEELAPS